MLRLCAIGVSCCAVVAAAQTSGALPAPLREQVKNGRFAIVTSIRGLPLGVRDELQTLFGQSTFEIAEPGTPFQVTDVMGTPRLPLRRLVAAGCTYVHCLVYYERGGLAHTWHVAMFRWTPEVTQLEWGGHAPGGLKSIDEVRNAILAGAIKSPGKSW